MKKHNVERAVVRAQVGGDCIAVVANLTLINFAVPTHIDGWFFQVIELKPSDTSEHGRNRQCDPGHPTRLRG